MSFLTVSGGGGGGLGVNGRFLIVLEIAAAELCP